MARGAKSGSGRFKRYNAKVRKGRAPHSSKFRAPKEIVPF
jgi:hypothetical protein